MSDTQTFTATGLTCEHCGRAVTEEVSALDGVQAVDVTVVEGGQSTVSVTTDRRLGSEEVAGALDEAGGYLLAD